MKKNSSFIIVIAFTILSIGCKNKENKIAEIPLTPPDTAIKPAVEKNILPDTENVKEFGVYGDENFVYRVFTETKPGYDSGYFECKIDSVVIISKAGNKHVQTIISGDDHFFNTSENDTIIGMEDVNFDGYNDILISGETEGTQTPYQYWIYNSKMKVFKEDVSLEDITSPEIDPKTQTITSSWRGSAADYGKNIYKYIDGKITLIEEREVRSAAGNSNRIIKTRKVRVNGKMKQVEKTIENRKEDSFDNI